MLTMILQNYLQITRWKKNFLNNIYTFVDDLFFENGTVYIQGGNLDAFNKAISEIITKY